MRRLVLSVCWVGLFAACVGMVSAGEFVGDWEGSGEDSTGQAFEFVARVTARDGGGYRMEIFANFDSMSNPMHVMDGELKGNKFTYTSDGGAYKGEVTLDGDVLRGWYKGDVDGEFKMRRVVRLTPVKQVDHFMGDWEGVYETEYGSRGDALFQVIALGGGDYRMNMIYQFDVRDEPMYVLNARLDGNKVTFQSDNGEVSGSGVLDGEVLKGKFQADEGGDFKIKRVVRLSPTLGAKPPKGAIVLFDGKNLDAWERMGGGVGIFDLAKLVGGDNTAAYIGTMFHSDAEQDAVVEVGSDDGVKVWLNGEVVHTNNASRGVNPGEDKIKVHLKESTNTLMLKVVNGAGGFGACVRVADENGKALSNIAEYKENESGDWDTTKDYLKANDGFLTVMYVCGPYRREGKSGPELMDIQFEPEINPMDAPWKKIEVEQDPKKARWIVKDGVMEVRDGSIRTKRNDFKDFKLHVEFKTPFMPAARGQGRGNSGVYLQNRYEVQVLDSYGLEGADNECGGVYQVGRPRVNMCAPPEQWQTYDIEFTGSKMENGQKKPAVLTVVHNGVKIHDEIKISGPTGGALDGNVLEPGGIYLQDHGNAVQYRNIWLAPK